MMIADGSDRSLALHWYPAAHYDTFIEDRTSSSGPPVPATIAGRDALLFNDFGGAVSVIEAWWREGDVVFDLRGDNFPTVEDYLTVAGAVREVDEATWLSLLPESIVRPDERPAVVDAALAAIPVADNVDVEALRDTPTANTADEIGYEVNNAVICGWVRQRHDGTETGDDAAVDEAVEAMTSSHE